MLRLISVPAILLALVLAIQADAAELSSSALDSGMEKSLSYFQSEQDDDGSWTALVDASSVMYTAQTIFLYEYLNLIERKRPIVDGMMRFIWTQQSASGGFPGFPGGPDNISISVEAYLAAKMAGEHEDSSRMTRLESYIKANGGLKKASVAMLFLMAFDVNTNGNCMGGILEATLLKMEKKLPWLRIMLYPFVHMYAQGKVHKLSPAKYPKRLGSAGFCPRWWPHPLRGLHIGSKSFYKWIDKSMNADGTLFDYAPTTVPALMAISSGGPKYEALVEKGLLAIEGFQKPVGDGIIQSPGEASIGETYFTMHALLDLGLPADHPMLLNAERFLWSMQQPTTGAFGFSKHNTKFPDADDTSATLYVLKRLHDLRGGKDPVAAARLKKGLDWVYTIQNPDGGFGTWERDPSPFMSRIFNRVLRNRRYDLSVSGAEQTARIILNLSLFKDEDPKARAAYDKSMKWLLKQQGADGSYSAIWMVNYLFCTATVLTTLGTDAGKPEIDAATEKALRFVLSHQAADGGFSESPLSYDREQVVALEKSSPAQTGLIVSQLLMFLEGEGYRHWDVLKTPLRRAISFIMKTQHADGRWHDPAWTGVTFPKLEYLIYPYIQEVAPLQALGMYKRAAGKMAVGEVTHK